MTGFGKYKPERTERRAKTAEQALSALMRLCSRSEKSGGDALRLMAGWGVPEGERAGVLKKLTDLKFIDDRRFAECYVRDKISFGGWGPYKITRGLASKGISREIIAEVAPMYSGKDKGGERLSGLLAKKMARTRYKDVYDLKGKLVRYAASQGYPYEETADAVEKLLKEKYTDND